MKFADVKNDVAFHKIFGNENRTDVLVSFLNSILAFEGDQRIVSITILNPYQLPKLTGGKTSIVDMRATDQVGRQYIIEMQVAPKAGFDKRVLYYTSRGYTDQIERGDFYQKLKPAIFVGILDFVQTTNPHYISRSQVQDIETGEQTIKDIEFNFIELPKFKKEEHELSNLAEKWIYFIKNSEHLAFIPDNLNDEGLKKAYQEANQRTWSKAEMSAYDYIFMKEEDGRAELEYATNIGTMKGKAEGKAEGERIAKINIAIKMKQKEVVIEDIIEITGLSEEEIKNL